MRKIPNLFVRDWNGDRERVRPEVEAVSRWVLMGDGVPTVKRDGTSCLWRDGRLWKRYDAKHGKAPPAGFVPAQEPDPVTGHFPGWIPVGVGPEDSWHREALASNGNSAAAGPNTDDQGCPLLEGQTYELVGPKLQGNPEGLSAHTLIRHGAEVLWEFPRLWAGMTDADAWVAVVTFLETYRPIEGIVWHHQDGRMAKVKRRDFGIPWPVRGPGGGA